MLAAAAVCVVCAMLICKAVKKNFSKKTAAVIGAAAFAGAVLAVIVIARTSGSLYTGNTDVSCFSIPQKSLIYSAFLFHRNPDFQRFPFL